MTTAAAGLNKASRWKLSLYSMLGALAPDIMILYAKRWTMPGLSFDFSQYAIVMAIYLALAGIVALAFPFKGRAKEWQAFALGVALPLVIAGLASTQRGELIAPRGQLVPGTILDLLSLY